MSVVTSELWVSLLIFAGVATISPGGATTLATASGVQFGFLRSIPLLAGIALGMATLIGSVAVGLASIIVSWPELQFWLRVVGSIYLLWLAWVICNAPPPGDSTQGSTTPFGFLAGYLMLWLNPKAWSMAFASAGAYSQLSENRLNLALLLGAVFAGLGTLSLTLWCVSGACLSKLIKEPRQWRIVNITLGLLIVASIVSMWFS